MGNSTLIWGIKSPSAWGSRREKKWKLSLVIFIFFILLFIFILLGWFGKWDVLLEDGRGGKTWEQKKSANRSPHHLLLLVELIPQSTRWRQLRWRLDSETSTFKRFEILKWKYAWKLPEFLPQNQPFAKFPSYSVHLHRWLKRVIWGKAGAGSQLS